MPKGALKPMGNVHREQENLVVIFYCINLSSVFKGFTLATYEISRPCRFDSSQIVSEFPKFYLPHEKLKICIYCICQ